MDDETEAVHSARAIVVELGVETVGWPVAQLPGCSFQDLLTTTTATATATVPSTTDITTPSYSEAPSYLIGVFHLGNPAVQIILLLVNFFCCHHQGGREGVPTSVQGPQSASDSLMDLWWILQDPSKFTLL